MKKVATAERWYERYGRWAVFTVRLVPIVRTVASYPAGISKMRYRTFFLATLIGSTVWCLFFTLVGVQVGVHWKTIFDTVSNDTIPAVIILVVLCVAYVFLHGRLHSRQPVTK